MKTLRIKSIVASATVIATCLFSAGAASAAEAGGLFVEPGLMYEYGNTQVDYPSPFSNSTGSERGFGLMGRLGVHFYDVLFGGLDVRYYMPQFKDSAVNYDATATAWNWGPVIGIQTPIVGLRAWASYVLGGTLDPAGSSNLDVKFKNAQGYRIGGGLRVLMLSINLEYQNITYGATDLEAIGSFNVGETFNGVKLKNDAWIASVSFPLDM